MLPRQTVGRYDLLPVFSDAALFDRIVRRWLHRIGTGWIWSLHGAIGWISEQRSQPAGAGFLASQWRGLPYPPELLTSDILWIIQDRKKTFEIPRHSVWTTAACVVDEWIETGAQLQAMCDLLERTGARIVGAACIGLDETRSPRAGSGALLHCIGTSF
jgi:adenine phosphoribosyltransferase